MSTKQLKNQDTCFQIKLFSIEKGMIKLFVLNLYNNHSSKAKLLLEAMFFIIILTIPEEQIQVQMTNEYLAA